MGISCSSCLKENLGISLNMNELIDNNNKNPKKEIEKKEFNDNISESLNPKSLESSINDKTSKENEIKNNLYLIYNEEGILESKIRFNNNNNKMFI